jgi:hypothetical protein
MFSESEEIYDLSDEIVSEKRTQLQWKKLLSDHEKRRKRYGKVDMRRERKMISNYSIFLPLHSILLALRNSTCYYSSFYSASTNEIIF